MHLCARVAVVLGCEISHSKGVVAGCVAGGIGGTGVEAERAYVSAQRVETFRETRLLSAGFS